MDTVELFDRVPLTGTKRDSNGNLICVARVSRAGIYDYAGFELGKPEMRRVRVYRPEDEVFSRDAMRSLAGAPVTIDHPKELVTTENWADHAKGEVASDDIVRDGETIRVPFILRDEGAIKAVADGKHELSPGYTALIDWTAGETPSGEAYDARLRAIRINHLAIVDKARGGSSCRIGDGEPREKKVDTKTILVDGLQVEVTDAAEAAINKLQGSITTITAERDETRTKLADAEKAKGELEGKVAALEQQVKDATDPAVLQKAAAERASLCDKAKALVKDFNPDGKTDAEIRKAVVTAKLGDTAKDFTDEQIAGAFATLAATVKDSEKGGGKTLTDAITDSSAGGDDLQTLLANRNKARDNRLTRLRDAHTGTADKE